MEHIQASSVKSSDGSIIITAQRATLKKKSRCRYSIMSVAGSLSEGHKLLGYERQ